MTLLQRLLLLALAGGLGAVTLENAKVIAYRHDGTARHGLTMEP